MALLKFDKVGISGMAACVPANTIVNYNYTQNFSAEEAKEVTDKTGIQQINPYFSDYLPDENGELKFAGYGHTSIQNFFKDVTDLMNGKVTLEHLQTHRPSFQSALPSTAIVEAVNESLKNDSRWTIIERELK